MNGDLRYGPDTDEAVEKMRSRMEWRRWEHHTDVSSDYLPRREDL